MKISFQIYKKGNILTISWIDNTKRPIIFQSPMRQFPCVNLQNTEEKSLFITQTTIKSYF